MQDEGLSPCGEQGDTTCKNCVVSVGRSGSKWMEQVCHELGIPTKSNRVDIGVRVELPAVIFSHLTDELYESKIVYRTEKFEDLVRTFCMNPNGAVVNENTNGIVTVNGHSYEDPAKQTENTNFALLVSKHFSEPFKDSNGYGESIARLSNMLGGGVIVQRFGDLIRGRRSTVKRVEEGTVTPTLAATPGDLSLVLPKRILDGIIEMIYALDKIAPGTANDDTLLYGVEVKFYNMEVDVDEHLETRYAGPVRHRRRQRHHPQPVPRLRQRRVCGAGFAAPGTLTANVFRLFLSSLYSPLPFSHAINHPQKNGDQEKTRRGKDSRELRRLTGKRAAGRTLFRELRRLESEQADAREFLPGASFRPLHGGGRFCLPESVLSESHPVMDRYYVRRTIP